jgi:hypothetical protein
MKVERDHHDDRSPMAVIRSAMFTISWTTPFPDVLADTALGRLTTRSRHARVYRSFRPDLTMPWQPDTEPATWSRFWSAYLGRPDALRTLTSDAAWERLVPFRLVNLPVLHGPVDATATPRALLYPSAVAVTITVRATGNWALAEFADAMAGLRTSNEWGVGAPGRRTLHGLATDLLTLATPRIAADGVSPGRAAVHTVAAPLTATDGTPDDLDPTAEAVRSCVSGLAGLGPPGPFTTDHLLSPNSDTNLAGRYYLLAGGLAIWQQSRMFAPSAEDRIACLVRNQTDLAVHVEALRATAQWAADRITAGSPLPLDVLPLLRATTARLRILHEGRRDKTYRSEVAKARIDPIMPALDLLRAL